MKSGDGAPVYTILIIYDIIDNKHRLKFSKLLDSYGVRVQKSCYEANLTNVKYCKLLSEIKTFREDDDNIRVYKITGCDEIITFGTDDYEEEKDIIII